MPGYSTFQTVLMGIVVGAIGLTIGGFVWRIFQHAVLGG